MRAEITAMALWLAASPTAMAQSGGYPASPSHGIVGAAPDGTPRYGREPERQEGRSPDAVGRSGAGSTGGQGERAPDAAGSSSIGNRNAPGSSQERER